MDMNQLAANRNIQTTLTVIHASYIRTTYSVLHTPPRPPAEQVVEVSTKKQNAGNNTKRLENSESLRPLPLQQCFPLYNAHRLWLLAVVYVTARLFKQYTKYVTGCLLLLCCVCSPDNARILCFPDGKRSTIIYGIGTKITQSIPTQVYITCGNPPKTTITS